MGAFSRRVRRIVQKDNRINEHNKGEEISMYADENVIRIKPTLKCVQLCGQKG